jgi:hypothetical protein
MLYDLYGIRVFESSSWEVTENVVIMQCEYDEKMVQMKWKPPGQHIDTVKDILYKCGVSFQAEGELILIPCEEHWLHI